MVTYFRGVSVIHVFNADLPFSFSPKVRGIFCILHLKFQFFGFSTVNSFKLSLPNFFFMSQLSYYVFNLKKWYFKSHKYMYQGMWMKMSLRQQGLCLTLELKYCIRPETPVNKCIVIPLQYELLRCSCVARMALSKMYQ